MAGSILRQALKPDMVKLRLESVSKAEAIRELVGILDDAGALSDPEEALRVVEERERIMSTGLEGGIAIPHGKTDTVDHLVVALALKPEGMAFDCQDGEPARILIITLSPASRTGPHLRFMADITRLLRDHELKEKILDAPDAETVVSLLTER